MISNSNTQLFRSMRAMLLLLACGAYCWPLCAQPPAPAAGFESIPGRRVYVPIEDLDLVFEQDHKGVVLSRGEFQELYQVAESNRRHLPRSASPFVLTRAAYTLNPAGEQLAIQATIELTQLAPGWHAVPLPFRGLNVESATLDGRPARLGRSEHGEKPLLLFLSGTAGAPGADAAGKAAAFQPLRQLLKLELSASLVSAGSDQAVEFGVPPVPAATLELTLPANKNLHVDELPVQRPAAIDQPAKYLVPVGGRSALSLRITDRETQNSSAALVFAASAIGVNVSPEELTWSAVSTLQVYGTPVDQLEFSVPRSLDIVSVESTGLERWEIVPGADGGPTLLKLSYRQRFQESRTVAFRGVATTVIGEPWSVPTLTLQSATSQIARIVVQHPPTLRLQVADMTGVRRVAAEDPGVPAVEGGPPVAGHGTLSFAAWQPDFSLAFVTQPKAREVQTTIATRLDIDSRELTLRSSVIVQSRFAPLFEIDLTIPADWTITELLAGNAPATWRTVPLEAGLHRVRVALAAPLPADGTVALTLVAKSVPGENWPVEDTPHVIKLPEVALPEAGVTEGTYMIAAEQDLDLTPEELTGLNPSRLPADQQQAANAPRLVYDYQDARIGGRLTIARKPLRLVARLVAFHRLNRETLSSHLEARVVVGESGLRKLQVVLPESAGERLEFELVETDTRIVEQTADPAADGRRVWNLSFDQRVYGRVWLIVDLQQARSKDAKEISLPALQVPAAAQQDGYVAIEAGPDQQLALTAQTAGGQPLPEIDPVDMPAPDGYAPRERIVAAYHAVLPGYKIVLRESRFERVAVPTAICDQATFVSVLGSSGELQHRAQFQLRAVGVQGLSLLLPGEATLWATLVDGKPVEVRRTANEATGTRFTVALSAPAEPAAPRLLQLFYRTQLPELASSGTLTQVPPQVAAVNGAGEPQPLEILSREWKLYSPARIDLVSSTGAFEPEQKLARVSLLGQFKAVFSFKGWDQLRSRALSVVFVGACIGLVVVARRRGRLGKMIMGLVCVAGLLVTVKFAIPYARDYMRSGVDTLSGETPKVAPSSQPYGDQLESLREEMPAADEAEELAAQPKAESRQLGEAQKSAATAAPQAKDERDRMEGRDFRKPDDQAANRELAQAAQPQAAPQPADMPAPPFAPPQVVQAAQGAPEGGTPKGGRLSLEMQLTPPAGSRLTQFAFLGNAAGAAPPALHLDYQNQQSISAAEIALEMSIVLMFWLLRGASASLRAVVGVLGLALPLGFVSIAPVAALPFLDGLFVGTLLGLGVWLLTYLWKTWIPASCQSSRLRQPVLVRGFWWTLGASLSLACGSSVAVAQPNPPPAAAPQVRMQVGPPAANVASTAADLLRDSRTLIIPYDGSGDPLKSDRVYLPYKRFVELWNTARPDQPIDGAQRPEALVIEALYGTRIDKPEAGGVVQVEVSARIVAWSYREERTTLALPLGPVAMTSARLDGQPAPLIPRDTPAGTELSIVLEGAGLHVLDCTFLRPVEQNGPAGRFTLPLKPVPAGSVRLTLPGDALKLKVNGATGLYRQSRQGEAAVAIIPSDKGGDLTLSWAPAQARDAVDGIVHAEAATAVILDDTGVQLSSGYAFNVRQGALTEVSFSLPVELSVRRISGPDLGGWEIAGEGADRSLKVLFRRRVTDATTLLFDLYLPHPYQQEIAPVVVPPFAPLGITRETGTLAVFSAQQLTITAGTTTGLAQIDVNQFTPAIKLVRPEAAPQLAYRYAARPFQLQLLAARQTPRSVGTAEHALLVAPRQVQVRSQLALTLAGAPRSEISLQLPPGYLLYDLQSADVADYFVEPRAADDEPQGTVLHVGLTAPRTGLLSLALTGIIPRDPADLSPKLGVPAPLQMNELRSSVAIWLDSIYSGNLLEFGGWKSIDPGQLPGGLRSLRPQPVQFAFSSAATEPQPIGLALKQARPLLSGDSLTAVLVGETSVQLLISLRWSVAQAAETRFHFTTPDWLEGKLDFSRDPRAPRVRQVSTVKLPQQRLRWTIELEEPQRNAYFVTARVLLPPPAAAGTVPGPAVTFEQEQPGGAGQPLEPLAQQQHFLLLVNQSAYRLDRQDGNAETVSADRLPIQIAPELVQQAAEVVQLTRPATGIAWQVRALQQLQRLAASVNLADMTLVLARDGSWRSKATYLVNNRSRQFLALHLPPGSTVLSLFVAGQPARPVHTRRHEAELLLVPLPKTAAGDLASEIQLVSSGRLEQALPADIQFRRVDIDLPAPRVVSLEEDPQYGMPVARTAWAVYLPDDLDANRIKDSQRTNVLEGGAGQERLVAELTEAMQLLSDLNNEDFNGRAIFNCRSNLKRLDSRISANPLLHQGQFDARSREISELYQQYVDGRRQLGTFLDEPVGTSYGAYGASQGYGDQWNQPQGENKVGQSKSGLILQQLEKNLQDENGIFVQESTPQIDGAFTIPTFKGGKQAADAAPGKKRPQGNVNPKRAELRGQVQSQSLALNAGVAAQSENSAPDSSDSRTTPQDPFQPNAPTSESASMRGRSSGRQIGADAVTSILGQNAPRAPGQPIDRDALVLGDQQAGQPGAAGFGLGRGQGGGGQGDNDGEGVLNQVPGIPNLPGAWSRAGGLSLPINLAQPGQALFFYKVGGDPKLALKLRPRSLWQFGLGLFWLCVCVGIAVSLIIAFSRPHAATAFRRHLPAILVAAGLAWFFLLPLELVGFTLFVVGAVAIGWRKRNAVAA